MNLIEARKLGHEGWVRSPTRTDNNWIQFGGKGSYLEYETVSNARQRTDIVADLDAEDWEPKPKPTKSFDCELLVHDDGSIRVMKPSHDLKSWELCGWRKIRVREVAE